MSIFDQTFPFPQSVSMSSTRGRGWTSGTVLSFKAWKSFTHRGNAVGSALGIRNAGDACAKADGRMRPTSRCLVIKVDQASLYLRGEAYVRVTICFCASFS